MSRTPAQAAVGTDGLSDGAGATYAHPHSSPPSLAGLVGFFRHQVAA